MAPLVTKKLLVIRDQMENRFVHQTVAVFLPIIEMQFYGSRIQVARKTRKNKGTGWKWEEGRQANAQRTRSGKESATRKRETEDDGFDQYRRAAASFTETSYEVLSNSKLRVSYRTELKRRLVPKTEEA